MRLNEYFSKVAKVVHHHQTDLEVMEAASMSNEDLAGKWRPEVEAAIAEVKKAITANKKLLGVFPDGELTEADIATIKEREISSMDLQRHILKVRASLRNFSNNAMISILTDLSHELGLQDLGGVFGKVEKQMFLEQFPEERANFTEPPKPAPKIKCRPGRKPGQKPGPKPKLALPSPPVLAAAPTPAPAPGPKSIILPPPPAPADPERENAKALEARLRAAGKIQ